MTTTIFGVHLLGRLLFVRAGTPLWFWLLYGAVTLGGICCLVYAVTRGPEVQPPGTTADD